MDEWSPDGWGVVEMGEMVKKIEEHKLPIMKLVMGM